MSALPASVIPGDGAVAKLRDWLDRHRRIFVLTGAGCSTVSGIPDYRDGNGDWKRTPPVTYQALVGDPAVYRRYWARGSVGWPRFLAARPNLAHAALARLETLANEKGVAVATAGGLPVTLERIARWAKTLEARGIRLVPISAAFLRRAKQS